MSDDGSGRGERERIDHGRGDLTTFYMTTGREPDRLDTILRVLAEHRCRYILYYLQEEEMCDCDDLATYVAATERGIQPANVQKENLDKISISLVHNHLPLLEDVGLVDHDQQSEIVRYLDPPIALETLVQVTAWIENLT